MNSSNGSIHVLPILVMFLGMLVLAAAIVAEFDGPRPLRGKGNLVLAVVGVGLLLGGALLLSAR